MRTWRSRRPGRSCSSGRPAVGSSCACRPSARDMQLRRRSTRRAGSRSRRSAATNGVDVQPQGSPSVSATRSETSAPARSAARRRRAGGDLIGDSGTKWWTRAIAAATGIAPATNSQRQPRLSTMRPEKTIPKPPPTPKTAESKPDPDLDLVRRELVADDPEAQREDRATGARMARKTISDADVPGERAADRAEQEDRERDDEHPLLAVLVAELAEQRRRDRGGQQEHRQHPGRPRGGRVELLAGTSRAPGTPSSAAARTPCRQSSGSPSVRL